MKKILVLILAGIFMMSSFISCSSGDKGNDDNKNKYEGMLVINEEYTVIRGELCDGTTTNAASYVKSQLTKATGCEISIKTDNLEEGDPNAKEIIIGKTKRKTEFDRTTLKEGEFYLGIEGNRIIIDAYDSTFLFLMTKKILSSWLTDEVGLDDGTLLMNDKICATLNALENPLDTAIVVMSQNLRYNNDGNGNDILDRAPRFKAEVEKYQPDLIGVQEVTALWREILQEDYSDKYGIIGVPRDGHDGTNESNDILYRLDRFELLESETFWLSDTPDVPSKLEGSSLNRICTWALLKDKVSGKTILMTNTHLDSPPASERQSEIIIDRFKDMMGKYPMFTTGDFNFKDYEEGYKIFTKSMFDSQETTIKNLSGINYTYNGFGTSNSHRIDFIFHNSLVQPVEYKILNDDFGGYVSDHYGIYTKYSF